MADVKISALTEETTPAAGMMFPVVSGAATKKMDLFKVQPLYLTPEMFGAIGDGSTNDATALQNMFNYQRDNGGTISMKNKIYRSNSVLTHQRNTTNGPDLWVIHTNGATISFAASGLTTGSLFTLGATSQDNGHSKGQIIIYGGLNIVGPETVNFYEGGTPSGSTIGIDLNYAFNITIDNPRPSWCYIGMRTRDTYPGLMQRFEGRNNGIDLMIENNSTLCTWVAPTFKRARYGCVVRPNDTTGVVLNQHFITPRFEQCSVAFVADQRNGTGFGLNGIILEGMYQEAITYDIQRWGTAWTWANVDAIGADCTRDIYNCKSYPAAWSGDAWTSTHHSLVLSTNGNVRGSSFTIPANKSSVVGSYENSDFRTIHDTYIGAASENYLATNAITPVAPGPGFSAYHGGASDVTGDNTLYTLIYDTVDFDIESDYNNGNGKYTAHKTGLHYLSFTVQLLGLLSGHDRGLMQIVITGTSAKTADKKFNPYNLADSTGEGSVTLSGVFYMTEGDEAVTKIRCTGSTKVVDIAASSYTTFCGFMVPQ